MAKQDPFARKLGAIAAVAAAYLCAGKLGLKLAFLHSSATAVWPASGIALAALLLGGRELWPGVFAGALLVNLTTPGSWLTAGLIAAGNTLEALAGLWALERFAGGRRVFDRPQRTAAFLLLGAALSPVLAATVGVSTLFLCGYSQGAPYGPVWLTWWLGDAAGIILTAPPILLARRSRPDSWSPARRLEAAGLAVALAAAVGLLFGGILPLEAGQGTGAFLLFPLIAWSCSRFGARETAFGSLFIGVAAVWGTLHGRGPFASPSPHRSLLLLQGFMVAVCGPSLVLACASAVQRRTEAALKKSRGLLARLLRRRTQALVHAEGVYRPLFESSMIGIFETDLQGRVLAANDAFLRLTGHTRRELVDGVRREVPSLGAPREEQLLRKDGARLAVVAGASRIPGEEGRIVGFVLDDSERRRAQAALREKAEDLARSNAELAQFASIASHDLQAPLHKIQGFGERLQLKLKGRMDAEADDYLRRMLRAADRMGVLIRDVLALARVTSRGQAFEPVDLGRLAREVAADLQDVSGEEAARIEVGPLPMLCADATQMRQLLQNLIGNALKFRRPGAPAVVKLAGRDRGDGFAEIEVEDNGIGFDPRYQERLFQPFSRLNSARLYDGSGMGLAICRRIALRHGGSIGAQGRPGQGARFVVVLPLARGLSRPPRCAEVAARG